MPACLTLIIFPLKFQECINCSYGVAGSGKSTLISRVLPLQHPSAKIIDQSPIAASSRANLLTYLGISDNIRNIFARKNSVSNRIFSRNGEGACPNCGGLGVEKLDLAFMEDVEEPCEVCHGSGFNDQVLKYKYNGKTIIDVMNLTVEEAGKFFAGSNFTGQFDLMTELGLGYLTLGQRLNTFSGGERQRLKLTKELNVINNILVLDEPSTGLHPSDNEKLLSLLNMLIEKKNTVVIIEHNLDIISQADWIIDMGPGPGKYGGKIIFEGTVGKLLLNKDSLTAKYLRDHLKQ
jgi:excinuclease UvrABC ATPase subunit